MADGFKGPCLDPRLNVGQDRAEPVSDQLTELGLIIRYQSVHL